VRPNRDLNVFHDVSLRGSEFRKFDLDLTADIGALIVYRDLTIKDIDAHAALKNSHARADVRANAGGGDMRAAVEAEVDEYGKISARAAGMGERIWAGAIMNQLRESDFISDLPMNFEFYLRAAGANLTELMSSVSGPVFAYSVGPGYAHSELVSYFFGSDFLTDLRHAATDLFRSRKKYDQISIGCAAVNVKARGGVVETERGIAMESNVINLRAAGSVDLGNEKIKTSLISVPVRGIKLSITGNVINNTEFYGNLAEPDIRINGTAIAAKAASATGLGLLLAPFTGGIGLLAGFGVGYFAGDLLDNWLADDHPCRTAMQSGAPAKDGDPEWMNRPMNELVGDMIK
jgi:hypothetical protein